MAATPTNVAMNSEYSPSATLKPANSIVASEGIGRQALSPTIKQEDAEQAHLVDDVDGEVDDRIGY